MTDIPTAQGREGPIRPEWLEPLAETPPNLDDAREKLAVPAVPETWAEDLVARFDSGKLSPDQAREEAARRLGLVPEMMAAKEAHQMTEPEPVLWRDYGDPRKPGDLSPIVSVGEVGILSAAGGLGKSTITLALAAAATAAAEDRKDFGEACGLRVRGGPVAVISYEDSPARIAGRLKWQDCCDWNRVHILANPLPLWEVPEGRGAGDSCSLWDALWAAIRERGCRLVIIDPASAACLAPASEAPAVRGFLRALMEAAAPRDGWDGAGVLIVAHSTKEARNAAGGGEAPGAGVVAGSAAWYDGARGVLTLYRATGGGEYVLHCVKANYGRVDWGAHLVEHWEGDRWRGLRAASGGGMEPEAVRDWMMEQKHRRTAKGEKKDSGSQSLTPEELSAAR